MGTAKDYILIAASIFISLSAIMVLLAMIEPHVFSLVPGTFPDSLSQVKVDSTGAIAPTKPQDTTATAHHTEVHGDSLVAHKLEKSKSADSAFVGIPPVGQFVPPAANPDTLTESEVRNMAQIFESMDSESAARILNNMSDGAVRRVITTMKKRQSAKILAALDPKQAARILKEKTE